jgi:hypothetical protein
VPQESRDGNEHIYKVKNSARVVWLSAAQNLHWMNYYDELLQLVKAWLECRLCIIINLHQWPSKILYRQEQGLHINFTTSANHEYYIIEWSKSELGQVFASKRVSEYISCYLHLLYSYLILVNMWIPNVAQVLEISKANCANKWLDKYFSSYFRQVGNSSKDFHFPVNIV